jgi:hypothetical protein
VLVAEAAKLLVLNPTGMLLLVLGRRVVPSLAVRTFKRNNVSHRDASGMTNIAWIPELATGIEPVTSSLPRKCSTN